MSYENRYSGEITITPPVTWGQLRDADAPKIADVRLRIDETTIDTDAGQMVTRQAVAIAPLEMTYSGHELQANIQALVDYYGPLGHRFSGYIQVQWDPGFDDPIPQRYIVRDGRVVAVKPQLLWPGEAIRSAHGEGI